MATVDIETIDIEIYRGDDTTVVMNVTDETNSPIDFTGTTLSMLIEPKRGDSYLLELGKGLHVTGNEINVIFSHDLTKDWDFRSAKYDLQVIDSRGKYKTIARGEISVIKDITP